MSNDHICNPDNSWFDRSTCPEPCGMMHYRCYECGAITDGCVFEDSGNAVVPLPAESADLWNAEVEALRGNMFAINSDSGTVEDRIGRLLALLPVAFQVVEEARSTIARLRDEVYDLSCKSGLDDLTIELLRRGSGDK